jgi:chitosanase
MDRGIEALSRAITNIFEVDSPDGDYRYVEDLEDGRGFTVSQYGFCENTGDLKDVIAASGMGAALDIKKNRDDFPDKWKKCIADPSSRDRLIRACESVVHKLYWQPAVQAITEDGLSDNAFAHCLYYDTLIQHGGGDDPDSFYSIRKKAGGDVGKFLQIRKKVLQKATDPETRKVWRESVDRVDELAKLSANTGLTGELTVSGHKLRGLERTSGGEVAAPGGDNTGASGNALLWQIILRILQWLLGRAR